MLKFPLARVPFQRTAKDLRLMLTIPDAEPWIRSLRVRRFRAIAAVRFSPARINAHQPCAATILCGPPSARYGWF